MCVGMYGQIQEVFEVSFRHAYLDLTQRSFVRSDVRCSYRKEMDNPVHTVTYIRACI